MKTDDKIDLLSKYGREAFKNFYYAELLNFKTQISPGYYYPNDTVKISDFFAPAYLLGALGMDYKPNAYFSAFIAPLTAKFIFVNDPFLSSAGAFGVTPGEKVKSEFLKNVSFTTKIDLFSNYIEKPQNIDVSWETLIAMKVNKYLSFNFSTHLIYGDNTKVKVDRNNDGILDAYPGSRLQFKEIFGAGFAYKF